MPSTLWERVKTGGKKGFDATWKAVDKVGAPVNRLSNKLGSEAFWPTTLDKESDKAARILKSFCKDGFYAEEDQRSQDGPTQKQKVIKKIPASVIKNAKGLAIFTTMRTGLWVSGAGGSGILVARLPDGSWSPPSGILLHTAGLGFLVGVDIYDCVVVINTEQALKAFTKIRATLGSEISVVAGPVGAGAMLETEIHKRQAPIFTYLKSRGFYAGVQIDGTVIIERTDENERFYRQRIPVADILAGKVRHPPLETRRLMETIKAAQGDTHFDASALPSEPPPGDFVVDDGHMFGVPDKEDPDPYGVLALEKEGLSLKEAGTHKRASWETFSFNPSPTSPIHQIYARNSQDRASSASMRSSWRASAFANEPKTPSSLRASFDTPRAAMSDMSTQTDSLPPPSPGIESVRSGLSRRSSKGSFKNRAQSPMPDVPENGVVSTPPDVHESTMPKSVNGYTTPPVTPPFEREEKRVSQKITEAAPIGKNIETSEIPHPDQNYISDGEHGKEEDDDDDDDDDYDVEEAEIIEQPVVHSVRTIQPTYPLNMPQARVVTVAKRVAPQLPPRNPKRGGRSSVMNSSTEAIVPEANVSNPEAEIAGKAAASVEIESPIKNHEEVKGGIVDVVTPMSEMKLDNVANGASSTGHDEAQKRKSMSGGFE
ncbi:Hypothetical protein R9X50_00615500 [Acrodontium crateriforme]|uniref:Ysc84 actin-binding domain-containing protein n=1 Tax=Acrodontium crateriforme TaxID=150365 RepID=A0AAQ3MAK2_9PEZI|nr:Hypothetical protein R9X50_00615500 [Acrodontium crateriforme]